MINKLSRYLVNIGKLHRGKLWQQENLANLVNEHVFSYFYHPNFYNTKLNNLTISQPIDCIYTYPGLHTELVNTNQHLQSTLYLHIHISVTLLSISFEMTISNSESHHVVTEEKGIIL